MTKELMAGNYMEALLHAAFLLGDLHRTVPICEITISGFLIRNHVRTLYRRCRIAARTGNPYYPAEAVRPEPPGEAYLILYPIRESIRP